MRDFIEIRHMLKINITEKKPFMFTISYYNCKNTSFCRFFMRNMSKNLFISYPLYHFSDRWFFAVHQNTYPVNFGGKDREKHKCPIKQQDG